jgi:hypothetical protein
MKAFKGISVMNEARGSRFNLKAQHEVGVIEGSDKGQGTSRRGKAGNAERQRFHYRRHREQAPTKTVGQQTEKP